MTFGEFIKEKRQIKGFTLRSFAGRIGIAPAYMSDIEKSKRNAPTKEILDKMIEQLDLPSNEASELYDLAAKSKDAVAQDLKEYLSDIQAARVALRKAKELNLKDAEWLKIIEEISKKN